MHFILLLPFSAAAAVAVVVVYVVVVFVVVLTLVSLSDTWTVSMAREDSGCQFILFSIHSFALSLKLLPLFRSILFSLFSIILGSFLTNGPHFTLRVSFLCPKVK